MAKNTFKFMELSKAEQDQSRSVKFIVNAASGVVVCKMYDRLYNIYHVAKTRCKGSDVFDEMKGRKIAFYKARKKELEYNLNRIEKDRKKLDAKYNEISNRLNKYQHLNVIYLEGVNDELNDLMNK